MRENTLDPGQRIGNVVVGDKYLPWSDVRRRRELNRCRFQHLCHPSDHGWFVPCCLLTMRIIPVEGLNAVAWIFTTLALLLTLGRFHIHWRKNRHFGWDDYFNGLALIFLLGFTITYQLFVPIEYNAELYALGLGGKRPTHQDVALDRKLNVANIVLFFCTIYAVKASFLALYWQMFEVSTKFRIAWILVSVYTVVSFLASFLAIFWNCGSPEHFLEDGYCGQQGSELATRILSVWCSLNIFGDLLLMVIPLVMLSRMLMPTSQKLGIAFIFSLVLITIVFDTLRTVFTLSLRTDFIDENAVWSLLEPTIGVIVCALPCYGGFLTWLPKRPFSSFIISISKSFSRSSSGSSKKSSGSSNGSLNRLPSNQDMQNATAYTEGWRVTADEETGRK
ncbi:hypothetical protein P280DRAFT_91111 [Massarina eburnea CBS 473.64]|uniref:Rhodopsin domain-containing protein n=1 Tax=Massarina eburnea CBS 473.64 TaxID=1395130 RepID=A0A6A6RSL6_9PLEO|nr:hypothetical protein P280DRAFT_91111 [Massarina eburnea CBS 473.64]